MRIFSRFSIILMSLGLCAVLVGCQKQGADQVKPKTDTSKSDKGTSAGAKVDSAIEKTKEKAQEVGSAAKEKTQELTSKATEKKQDAGSSSKNEAKSK